MVRQLIFSSLVAAVKSGIRDQGTDLGSGIRDLDLGWIKIRIRDTHPGSA
jgi:hypothetical protein